ncbi:zinc finger protein 407, partial [Sigmodon hispidus]
MDSESKHENDEDEEATDMKSISSHDASCGPVSDGTANASANFMSKRVFSELSISDSVAVEGDRGELASKRMRMGAVEPLETGEQGTCGSDSVEARVHLAEAGKEAPSTNHSDEGRAPPSVLSSPCDFSTCDTLPLKADAVKKSAQERVSLAPERHNTFSPEEMSITCSFGNAEPVVKCSMCGHSFSSCSALEKHVECLVGQEKECACCQCRHRAESSSSLHLHGPQKTFSCDLCGFQCAEENLLNAHYLGKTHLRRQNLAARGGFVQILTKQPFPKKTCIMGTKNVKTKPRASKPLARNGDSKGVQNTGNKPRNCRGPLPDHSAGSSELLVEMVPSRNNSSGKEEIVEENVTFGVAQNPENQNKQLVDLESSEGLLGKSESIKNTLQIAHISMSTTSRPRSERSLLVLGNSFRRRSGTFTLKGQPKKRFNLLGINKRGTNDTQRMYTKHFRAQMRTSDGQPTTEHIQVSKDIQSPCVTTSDNPEVIQDKTASDHQVLCTYTECGYTAADKTDLEIHVKRCHAREMQFSCHTCDFSSPSRKDLEEHLHSNQHQQMTPVLNCQSCSFVSLNEMSLRDHTKEKHSTSCNLFLSEKDVEEHRAAEMHDSSVVQPKIASSLSSDSVLPLSTLESENMEDSRRESGKAAKEDPMESRVSHGTEARHSSKPQFQCKKCFYKTRSSTVLTRHIKLRHGQDYHFLCKACNLYSLSKEGMEKHIKRSKHLENAKKNNIGLSFEECIERVCIGENDKKEESGVSGSGRPEGHAGVRLQEHSYREQSLLTPKELPQSGVITKDDESALTTTPKRGKAKGSISRTCSHCGLLASSITNLTVHIRRKHSHQYSYLCKVCKYYTVTKGDMERHCATKKHKGRVEIEANGKQGSDIIVGPEAGNIEACKKNNPLAVTVSDEQAVKSAESDIPTLDKPVVDHGNAVEVEAENVFHPVDGEVSSQLPHRKGQISLETEDLQQNDACSQRDVAGSSDNKCLHCEFSAHSAASLELHVKRKHTKEFEFYCMACDYFAVTRREMTRHAATEKHKMKRQCYFNPSYVEAGPSEMSRSILRPEEEHSQNPEEFKMKPDQSSSTLKSRNATDCSILDENTNLDMSKVLCASDSVEIVTEEEHSFCETLQQPLVKDKSMKPGEIVSLNTLPNHDSAGCLHNKNPENSRADCETTKKSHGLLDDASDPSTCCEEGDGTADHGSKVLAKSLCSGDLDGDQSAESTVVLKISGEQLDLEGGGQNSGDLKDVQANPVFENKEILMYSQHETEVVLEEDDGPASDGTVDSNDVYETIVSIDDKGQGQTMYNFGRFDSSIIRIKTSEDGELVDQLEEGLMATGVRVSELPPKDCAAQGLKKRKVEGGSFGESTRIRCDDCGFLADGLSGLNVHIAMKHPTKEKHFHCLLCGKSFYTESNLHQHLASAGHMRNEQASVEELPEGGATFKCVKCTEPFDSEQSLFLHIKGQHEELLREVNKYIVEDTEQINREREENQGNICKYCGKMCRSSNSMAFLAHIRTHT